MVKCDNRFLTPFQGFTQSKIEKAKIAKRLRRPKFGNLNTRKKKFLDIEETLSDRSKI